MIDSIEAVSYLAVALYLLHLGRRLQREQDAEDRATGRNPGAPPSRLTFVEPPPAPGLEHPRQADEGKPCVAGGIPHPERLRLERAL